ncbi:MAG: protein kinase [Planctomycetota bacterium]
MPGPGDVLAGCHVVRELGRGGMGAVYLARTPAGQAVAIKLLLGTSPQQRERFRREAAATRALDHPGIVRMLSADLEREPPVIVLEFVEGRDLDAVLADAGVAREERLDLFVRLCGAIQHAHERGVVHRDLKPQNVLVTPGGQPRVTDFGLARELDRATRVTNTGNLLGTPHYMAPEQVRAAKEAGPAADVYALGVILVELLCGQRPFQGENLVALLHQVLFERPRLPSASDPGLAPFDAVCARALAREPEERPSARELAALVEAARAPAPPAPSPLAAVALMLVGVVLVAGLVVVGAEGLAPAEPEPALAGATPADVRAPVPAGASSPGPSGPAPAASAPPSPTAAVSPSAPAPRPSGGSPSPPPLVRDPEPLPSASSPRNAPAGGEGLRGARGALDACDPQAARLALARAPEGPERLLLAARASDLECDFDGARRQLGALLQRADAPAAVRYEAHLLAARLAAQASDREAQRAQLDAAIADLPTGALAYARRGFNDLLRDTALERVKDDLERALSLEPDLPEARLWYGVLTWTTGSALKKDDPTRALRFGEAQRLVDGVIARHPDLAEGYAMRAWLLAQAPDHALRPQTRPAARRALELYTRARDLCAYFARKGEALSRRGAPEGMPILNRALAEDPRHPYANMHVAFLTYVATKAFGRDREDRGKGYRAVLKQLDWSLAINPELWEAYMHQASVLLEGWAGTDARRAVASLGKALERAPARERAHLLVRRSRAHIQARDPEAGLKDAEEALAITTQRPDAWEAKAAALAVLGRAEERAEALQRAGALRASKKTRR